MFPPDVFLRTVVRPTLATLARAEPRIASTVAEQLMLGTALAESGLSRVVQRSGGPALGYFQIEPATWRDVSERYLPAERTDLLAVLGHLVVPVGIGPRDQAALNDWLGCAVARIRYWMEPAPLPSAGDWGDIAGYWKTHYNTPQGAGTVKHFLAAVRPITHLWEDAA